MNRDYGFYESTSSLCSTCFQKIPAKIVFKDEKVFLLKNCSKHGKHFELLEEDIEYHKHKRDYDKPGTICKTQTVVKKGCPFDCGLCTDHDQHTCIGLIEITNACNLSCPTCYACSGKGTFLPLKTIERMMDFLIETEGGEAEILQISGGEPTLHPQIIEIITLARTKKIKYIMLNTNGLRIAEDEKFVKQLAEFKGRFEIYLQFDGFSPKIYATLRNKDILAVKLKAIENLRKYNIPITLVSTIQKGLNDNEIGKILRFGMDTKGIRGVNFQPVAYFGRGKLEGKENRITLSGIINQIEKQLPNTFSKGDIIPLPCNVERVAVTYMLKNDKGKFIPLTRHIKVKNYLPLIDNTFAFNADELLQKQSITNSKSITNNKVVRSSCCDLMDFFKGMKNIFPARYMLKSTEEKLQYLNENSFRVSITSFVDGYNFDLKSMQKECVHIITPELKKIPFSAYNMLYRKVGSKK